MRQEALFRSEAAIYAISEMSRNLGIRFGAVIINSCYKATRAATMVANILSGHKEITWNRETLDPASIVALIASYSSGVTKKVRKPQQRDSLEACLHTAEPLEGGS